MNLSGKFGKCSSGLNANLSLDTPYQTKLLLFALNQIRVELKGNHRLSLRLGTQMNFNLICTSRAWVSVEHSVGGGVHSVHVHYVGEVVKSSALSTALALERRRAVACFLSGLSHTEINGTSRKCV